MTDRYWSMNVYFVDVVYLLLKNRLTWPRLHAIVEARAGLNEYNIMSYDAMGRVEPIE